MIRSIIALLCLSVASLVQSQETPGPMVATYDALAGAILSVKRAEREFVLSLLDHHRTAAAARVEAGDYAEAGAHMALFANEGDNAVAGIRKRLLEGGHHHNAEGEAQGIFEPGYVIVTREAKKAALSLSAKMRKAESEAAAMAVWSEFDSVARGLLGAND